MNQQQQKQVNSPVKQQSGSIVKSEPNIMMDGSMRKAIMQVLPKYMTADRFMSLAISASKLFEKNQKINKSSLYIAVYQAAQYGLEIGGPSQQAHLVPFGNLVQLITGYKGLIFLAKKNGNVKEVKPFIVYEKDEFSQWNDDTGSHFKHVPFNGAQRGNPIGVYTLIWFNGDEKPSYHYTHIDRVELIEKNAKKRGGAVWTSDREAMILKTGVRQAMKYQSISPEIDSLITKEEKLDMGMVDSYIPEPLEGIVDTTYQEVVQENNEAVDRSTKPETEAPRAVTRPANDEQKTVQAQAPATQSNQGATNVPTKTDQVQNKPVQTKSEAIKGELIVITPKDSQFEVKVKQLALQAGMKSMEEIHGHTFAQIGICPLNQVTKTEDQKALIEFFQSMVKK